MVTFSQRTCPFCGLPSEVPHETQAVCIEALREEIDRTRQVLDSDREAPVHPSPGEDVELA